MQTQTETDRARWAAAFADRLAGFEPGPYPDVDEAPAKPASPASRLKQSQAKAAARAQRARDKARRSAELDSAIADGLRSILRQRKALERMRDGEALTDMAVRIEPIFGTAMERLVKEHGWNRALASKALTARLLRPEKPPA
jgi:hypothetical protein